VVDDRNAHRATPLYVVPQLLRIMSNRNVADIMYVDARPLALLPVVAVPRPCGSQHHTAQPEIMAESAVSTPRTASLARHVAPTLHHATHHDAGVQDEVIDARQPLQRRRSRPHAGEVRQVHLLHADAAL
jgi:hypothetical protein